MSGRPRYRLVTALITVLVGSAATVVPAAYADPVPPANAPAGAPTTLYQTVETPSFTLEPMGSPGDEREYFGGMPRVPGAYGLKSIIFDVVDANTGDPVSRDDIHLHHLVLVRAGAQDPACPQRMYGSYRVHPILATGMERTPIILPDPYAYRVLDSDIWGGTYHIMNKSDRRLTLKIRYTVGYQPDANDQNTRWVQPWFMDIDSGYHDDCGDAVWDIPGDGGPGSTHERSHTWTMPRDGIIVGTGSHLHQGGLYGEMVDGDGHVICRSDAVYVPGSGHDHTHATVASSSSVGPHDGVLDRIVPCRTHHRVSAGEEITLKAVYDNSMPWDDVMGINLTFIWWGTQPCTRSFPDAPSSGPFADAVEWLGCAGVSSGYPDGTYRPRRTISRGEAARFLYNLEGGDHSAGDHEPSFSDVPESHPHHEAIEWLAHEAVARGYPDGTFRPASPVLRQELVAWLWRLAGSPSPESMRSFTDVSSASPFAAAIAWAKESGIVQGRPDGTFSPTAPVTRQETARILFWWDLWDFTTVRGTSIPS